MTADAEKKTRPVSEVALTAKTWDTVDTIKNSAIPEMLKKLGDSSLKQIAEFVVIFSNHDGDYPPKLTGQYFQVEAILTNPYNRTAIDALFTRNKHATYRVLSVFEGRLQYFTEYGPIPE